MQKQKSNPFGSNCEPWLARKLALIDFRVTVRDALESRNLAAVEAMLCRFALRQVRGDYVPTIADGYAELVRIVNSKGPQSRPTAEAQPFTVQAQTIFAGTTGFRVEVRLVPVPQNHNHKTP